MSGSLPRPIATWTARSKRAVFRHDLYHRLNVVPIALAPLRERAEDIPVLAHYFMDRYAKEAKKNFNEIAVDALKQLSAYEWPGNVRELGNVIERAIVLGRGPQLTIQDFPSRVPVASVAVRQSTVGPTATRWNITDEELFLVALERCHGNRAAAARQLGLHEKYFLRLLKSLAIGGE